MRRLVGTVLALSALLSSAVWHVDALAQTVNGEDVCTGRTQASAAERRQACSSLISSGGYSGDRLAILLTSRGAAWRAEGDTERALADQTEAIRIQPSSAILHFNRAVTKHAGEEWRSAVEDYDKAIELAPDFALALKNRGDAHVQLEDYASAIADYDRVLALAPDTAEVLVRRGLARLETGDADGRNADLRDARFIDARLVARLLGPGGIAKLHGQGFIVRKEKALLSALQLTGSVICTTADPALEASLEAYFEAWGMTYLTLTFSTLEEAVDSYDKQECDVLAGELAALSSASAKLTDPSEHRALPEVFAR